MNDIIRIVLEAAITIVIALSVFAFNKYMKPWLVENNLMGAAEIAVRAAEAMWGRYNGKDKLETALAQLSHKGFDITAQEVLAAVNAAWQKLNSQQIASGEKTLLEPQETAE